MLFCLIMFFCSQCFIRRNWADTLPVQTHSTSEIMFRCGLRRKLHQKGLLDPVVLPCCHSLLLPLVALTLKRQGRPCQYRRLVLGCTTSSCIRIRSANHWARLSFTCGPGTHLQVFHSTKKNGDARVLCLLMCQDCQQLLHD
jgi:hypothetical protein